MIGPVRVSEVRFVPASERDQRLGVLGYTSFILDGRIRIDGAAVRETLKRRLVLSFPTKVGRRGVEHSYIRPINTPTREAIEAIGLGKGVRP